MLWCKRKKEVYDQARAPKVETNDTYGAEEEEDKAEVEDANVYYGEVRGRVVTYCRASTTPGPRGFATTTPTTNLLKINWNV